MTHRAHRSLYCRPYMTGADSLGMGLMGRMWIRCVHTQVIPEILDSIDTKLLQKFFHKCWWYMDAYEFVF